MEKSHGKPKCQRSPIASGSPARALAAGFLHIDHVWITTHQFIRFHTNEFDEMPYKLDSNENPCSFEKYQTLPELKKQASELRKK